MWITVDHDGMAIRVTSHPVLRALSKRFGGPLVSTSANIAGREPARDIHQVRRYFRGEPDAIMPGAPGGLAKPTTIRDFATGDLKSVGEGKSVSVRVDHGGRRFIKQQRKEIIKQKK